MMEKLTQLQSNPMGTAQMMQSDPDLRELVNLMQGAMGGGGMPGMPGMPATGQPMPGTGQPSMASVAQNPPPASMSQSASSFKAVPGKISEIAGAADFNAVIKQAGEDKLVILDFFADWCRPCKMMEPILKSNAALHKDTTLFIKVNVDKSIQFCTAKESYDYAFLALFRSYFSTLPSLPFPSQFEPCQPSTFIKMESLRSKCKEPIERNSRLSYVRPLYFLKTHTRWKYKKEHFKI